VQDSSTTIRPALHSTLRAQQPEASNVEQKNPPSQGVPSVASRASSQLRTHASVQVRVIWRREPTQDQLVEQQVPSPTQGPPKSQGVPSLAMLASEHERMIPSAPASMRAPSAEPSDGSSYESAQPAASSARKAGIARVTSSA
jgi:hypothetical protein